MNQEEIDNIFNHKEYDVPDDELIEYASDKADTSTQHKVEAATQDDPFMQDALEGITAMQQKDKIPVVIELLNQKLNNDLRKSQKKHSNGIENINLILLACGVLLIIILIVVYFYLLVG